ncbi:hypothetical protein J4G48_0006215 [Bradyrhizobium barranii subsp. apii]|uniref:hypothetical protein n=1 Tax=Bradyrhizobium TaxID=374 RepID=UPI0015969168|nr:MULTISPECIES: hypothetical protein [Bradyrhizobium]UGY28872.1 hypothetical protein HU675_0020030 [Bradyrhizobium septentrionale]UPT97698.1 hypothetical protein J4G48_0006215 [Bradyrhizobium barranii subsp. apii]
MKFKTSEHKIVERLAKVRNAACRASKSKRRFADYRFLRSVLRAYDYFSDENLLPHLSEIAPSVLMTPVRTGWHPLRIIIEATCIQPDVRMRSRWTRALEFAAASKIDPDDLPRFFQANGGIAGTADMASKTRPKRASPRRPMNRAFSLPGHGLDLRSNRVKAHSADNLYHQEIEPDGRTNVVSEGQ